MHKNALIAMPPFALFSAEDWVGGDVEMNRIPDHLRAILENAEHFELLSINPVQLNDKPKDNFQGWTVLGKAIVNDAETRKKLIAAFKKGVEENKGDIALCFDPRHGIRVTHDGKTVDFVICYECFQVHTFVGDNQDKSFLVTASPQPTFDCVLKEANVPLAEKPGR